MELATLWLLYFLVHSALASLRVKRWFARRWPASVRFYRIVFNLTALILLAPIVWQMAIAPGPELWRWQGWALWLRNALTLLAVIGFAATLRDYDSGEFLGLRQWRAARSEFSGTNDDAVDDRERFHLSPIHRHVRHPWYFFALVLIWTRDMNGAMLTSAALATLYFVVGSRLEEAKLIRLHGDIYVRYRRRVPGLCPLPGRSLSREEAAALVAEAAARMPDNRKETPCPS